jgi:hypothetical protein
MPGMMKYKQRFPQVGSQQMKNQLQKTMNRFPSVSVLDRNKAKNKITALRKMRGM